MLRRVSLLVLLSRHWRPVFLEVVRLHPPKYLVRLLLISYIFQAILYFLRILADVLFSFDEVKGPNELRWLYSQFRDEARWQAFDFDGH